MPKKAKELSALAVGRLVDPGLHFVGGVAGLSLQVTDTGARSWILRATVGDVRRDIGLGGFPDVTLAGARDAARVTRVKIREGINPVEERKALQRALIAARESEITFSQAAAAYIKSKESGWKNDKHRQQWENTLERYAQPVIGKMLVRNIEQSHVLKILEPIWEVKTETASRVRGRIESVLDWAKGRGYRSGDNPAEWKGNLKAQLAAPKKVSKPVHLSALPYQQINAFLVALRKQPGVAARSVEFAILTAARSGEVRGAKWSEIDGTLWTIPADRMKAEKEHWVPLSDRALELLRDLSRTKGCDLVFPSAKCTVLSDMALTAVLRRMNTEPLWVDGTGKTITVHGFRSTFRDWAGETTLYPREVIEHALAHQLSDKAEAAYARGTLLAKRRLLMTDWGQFVSKAPKSADVVAIMRKA